MLNRVAALNRDGGVVATSSTNLGTQTNLLVFDRARQQAIVANQGISPGRVSVFAFDGGSLDEVRSSTSLGSNGRALALSPDSNHLAYAVAGGNTNTGYLISDLSPVTLTGTTAWNPGSFPSGAAFSPDGLSFATTNTTNLMVYDVQSKTELFRPVFPAYPSQCSFPSMRKVAFSRGGRYVFGLVKCSNSTNPMDLVVWAPFVR